MVSHQELVSLLTEQFEHGGWAIAFQPIRGFDLQATRLWGASLITFLFSDFQGDEAAARALTDEEFKRLVGVERRSRLGAKITVIGHLHFGVKRPGWSPGRVKRSDFLKRIHVVNWLVDVGRKEVVRNAGVPVVRAGLAEIRAALAGRRACPLAR